MYELQTGKNKSIYILMLIIVLVAFFTILAYTLFIDSHEYKYSQNIVATQIKHEEESTELETILENTTESIVGISKIKDIGTTIFLEKSTEHLNLGTGVIISKEGYIFAGWLDSKGQSVTHINPSTRTGDIELTASWQPRTYSITYEGLKGATPNNPTSYTIETNTITLQDPGERNGYTFTGWVDEKDQPITEIRKGLTGDRVITAKWNVVTYTITYNGLEGATHSNPTSYTIETDTITLQNPSVRDGYTFTGWEDRGLKVTSISKGTTGNLTLTATWDANAYSITYQNVEGAINPNPVSYKTGESVAFNSPTKKGYDFVKWVDGNNNDLTK